MGWKGSLRNQLPKSPVFGVSFAIASINTAEALPPFNNWKQAKMEEILREASVVNNSKDEILQGFTCPISGVVMDWPARTPSGHSYELMAIKKCTAGPNMIKDPMRNAEFPVTALQEDYEAAFIINRRVVYLLQSYEQKIVGEPEIKKILSNLIVDFEKLAFEGFEEAKDVIEKRRVTSGDCNRYMEELQEFFNVFGKYPKQEVDWSINWKKKLDERFKYFNPDAVILG